MKSIPQQGIVVRRTLSLCELGPETHICGVNCSHMPKQRFTCHNAWLIVFHFLGVKQVWLIWTSLLSTQYMFKHSTRRELDLHLKMSMFTHWKMVEYYRVVVLSAYGISYQRSAFHDIDKNWCFAAISFYHSQEALTSWSKCIILKFNINLSRYCLRMSQGVWAIFCHNWLVTLILPKIFVLLHV